MGEATEAIVAEAMITDAGPSALFEVPGRASIPSDGQPHRNTISMQELKGKFSYEVTPKLALAAYLKARVDNGSGAPLLAGPINIFLGNDYVGRSHINLVSANAGFDLYLGRDDSIKVTRKKDIPKEETGGILTATRVYKRGYTITVENFKKGVEEFQVNDQIPVSQKGSLDVVVDRLPQNGLKENKETGELTWTFSLKPQEKRTIDVAFQIQCDPKAQVVGL